MHKFLVQTAGCSHPWVRKSTARPFSDFVYHSIGYVSCSSVFCWPSHSLSDVSRRFYLIGFLQLFVYIGEVIVHRHETETNYYRSDPLMLCTHDNNLSGPSVFASLDKTKKVFRSVLVEHERPDQGIPNLCVVQSGNVTCVVTVLASL